MSFLKLTDLLPGIGCLEEAIDERVDMKTVFDGLCPLSADWHKRLDQPRNKQPREVGFRPRHFNGWLLAGDDELKSYVVYQSMHLLADAIERRLLSPVVGMDSLREIGLVNSRGKCTPTHLQKQKRHLDALGLLPANVLWSSKSFTVVEEPGQPVRLFQSIHQEHYTGILIAAFMPCDVQTACGDTYRSATWVARACQKTRAGRTLPRPFLYFDGIRLQRLPHLDALPLETRDLFEKAGHVVSVDQSLLLPPITYEARCVVRLTGAKCTPKQARSDVNHSTGDCAYEGIALVPAYAAVPRCSDVHILSVQNSVNALSTHHLADIREKTVRFPHNIANSDLYLCHRALPGRATSPPPASVRYHERIQMAPLEEDDE